MISFDVEYNIIAKIFVSVGGPPNVARPGTTPPAPSLLASYVLTKRTTATTYIAVCTYIYQASI